MADDTSTPTEDGQMPSWGEVKNRPDFQGLSPDQQLVAFDRWHGAARTQLAQADPQWSQNRTTFDTNANLTAHALGQAAAQNAGQERASTPDEARYRIAHDKFSQDPNATLPPDIAEAYYKGPPEGGRNFQIVGNQLKLFPGQHVAGMQDLVTHGIKDQEWFNQNSEAAGVLDKQYNDLVTSAGSNPQLKAMIDEGVKSYIGLQGGELAAKKFAPPIVKWLGARLASGGAAAAASAELDPEIAAAAAETGPGAVILPLAVNALAFLGGMMFTNKATQGVADQLSKYSDDVKSFEASAQLHPNYAAVGGLLGFAPAGVKTIPELVKMFSEPSVNVAGHVMSGPRAAIMQMGINGAASVPLTFAQAGMEGRLPTLNEGLQNAAIGMLLAGSPKDTPAVAKAKGDAAARIEAAMREAGIRTGNGTPQLAKAEIQQVKLEEAQKIMNAAKQDHAAAPINLVDKAEAKAGDHFVEGEKLFRMNEKGQPEEVLPPAQVAAAPAQPAEPAFAANREAATPDERGYLRYVENGANVEEGPLGERRIVAPVEPAPPAQPAQAAQAAKPPEQERIDQQISTTKDRIINEARQQAVTEGVPTAARAGRAEEIIAQERQVAQTGGRTDQDKVMREAYRQAHEEITKQAGPEERKSRYTPTEPEPGLYERTPPRAAGEIGKPTREEQTPLPPDHKLVTIEHPGGEQEQVALGPKPYTGLPAGTPENPVPWETNAKGEVPSIARLTPKGEWSHGMLPKGAKILPEPVEVGKPKREPTEKDLWGKAGNYLTDEQKAGVSDRFVERVTDIFDKFKPHKTIKDAAEGKFLKGWYEKFGDWMLDLMGPETPRFARLFGAFGANNSPLENSTRALDVWNTWVERGRPQDEASINKLLEDTIITETGRAKGRTAKDIMAWGNNVKRVLMADDPTKVKLSGPKVDPYASNFLGNLDRATLDRHMGIPYALQQGLPMTEAMRKGSTIFGRRRATTAEGDVLGSQGFPGMAYEAHLRHAAEIISEHTGEPWKAANVQEAIWGKYQPMKMLAEEMGVGLDDLLSGKVKYSKERLSELRAQIQPETILENPKVKAEIERLERAGQASGAERGAPTATSPGEQPGAGVTTGAGLGTGSESIATTGGPIEVSKAARDEGWSNLDKNRGWESEDDKHVRGLLEGTFPEMFQGKSPLFNLIAAENTTGHEVWVHADGSPDIYFDAKHILAEMGKQQAEGKSPQQYARKALTEEIVHKLTAVDSEEALRLGRELAVNTPELARSIAERYYSGGQPIAREAMVKGMLNTPEGNVHLYYEAIMDNALAQLRGEDRRADFQKMPQTMIEHIMKLLNVIMNQIRGRKEYAQFSPEMQKMVDTGLKGMRDLDQLYEQRFGKPFAPELARTTPSETAIAKPAREGEEGPVVSGAGFLAPNGQFHPGPRYSHEDTARSIMATNGAVRTGYEAGQSAQRHIMDRGYVRVTTEPGKMLVEGNPSVSQLRILKDSAIERGVELIHDLPSGKYNRAQRTLYSPGEIGKPIRDSEKPEVLRALQAQKLSTEGLDKNWDALKTEAHTEVQKSWGGVTIDPRTGKSVQPKEGYAVTAREPDQQTISLSEEDAKDPAKLSAAMDQARKTFADQLSSKDHYLGVFHDDGKKSVEIDPVAIVKTKGEVDQIAPYTKAEGGAYEFATGNGYFPPMPSQVDIGAAKREETAPQKMQARWENGKLVVEPQTEPAGGGMAVRVREQRMPGEVQTGAPRDVEQMKAIGEGRLAKGEDPQQVLNDLNQRGEAAKPEDIALFQAQTRKLSAVADAAKAAGDNAGAEKAYVQEKAWRDQLAPFQQAWHEAGISMQEGENLGNEFGMQRAFEARYGKDMSEPQKKAAEKPVKAVKIADDAVTKAVKSMDSAVGTAKAPLPNDAKSLTDYFAQRKAKGGEFIGASKRTEDLTFTQQEVQSIWKFSKPIIENLQSYGDVTRAAEHVSNALGGALSPEEIRTAWAQPKRVKGPVAQELFEAMSKRRAALDQAKSFLDRAEMGGFEKFMHDVVDFPRTLAILGHANPLITHAGRNLFTPEAWSNWGSAFTKQFKFLVDPAAHEIAMQRILEDPLYQEAKTAGLRVSPYELEDYSRYNKVLGQMLGSRLAAVGRAGNRAMDALKVFRMEMYKQYVDDLAGGLQGQDRKDAAKAVAAVVNHISGYSNNAATRFFKDIGFAPGLEGSRWAFIGDYKNAIKTTAKLATGQSVSAGERVQAKLSARRAAQFVGMMAGAMMANQALLKATGQDDEVNLAHPTQTDFMRFKWNGKTLDPTGGLFQPVRLLARLTAISSMDKGEKQGAFLKEIANYAAGKANPSITAAIEMATGQDAMGRALPGREPTTSKEPFTPVEYALTKAPIPVAEMSKVIHDGIAQETSPTIAGQIMNGMFGLGFGVLGVKQGETPQHEWTPRP